LVYNKQNNIICISMMLIPDLLNILFDQADYLAMVCLYSLRKRTTKYANKYSLLATYDIHDHILNNNQECVCERDDTKIIKQMVNNGIEQCILDVMFATSAKEGHVVTAKYLVDNGADIDAEIYDESLDMYRCALKFCVKFGRLEVVKYLVNNGSSFDWDEIMDESAWSGHLDVVKYLVEHGNKLCNNFNMLRHDIYGECASSCVVRRKLDMAEYFVSIGAKIDINRTLTFCAIFGYLEEIQYLVSIGADIDKYGKKALVKAARNGELHVVKYLISIGVKPPPCEYIFDNGVWDEKGKDVLAYLISIGIQSPPCECIFNRGVWGQNEKKCACLFARICK